MLSRKPSVANLTFGPVFAAAEIASPRGRPVGPAARGSLAMTRQNASHSGEWSDEALLEGRLGEGAIGLVPTASEAPPQTDQTCQCRGTKPPARSHRQSLPLARNRGSVPMAEIDPGLRREDEATVIFRQLELDTFAST